MKNNRSDDFILSSVGELRTKYYRSDEVPAKQALSPEKVPESLRALIPFAEKWGISDDMLRISAVNSALPSEIEELKATISRYDDALDEWLAGPEAGASHPSAEYLAFSNMRMAADGC